ncbi:MAG: tetratricopeptide repeat protein [Phycisphaerales bacterium]
MPRITTRHVLGLALVSCLHVLTGCAGHGDHTSEYISEAKIKMAGMKAGVDWQMSQEQFLAGELDKALRSVDNSIEVAPQVAKSHLLRGRIMIERGELEEARKSLVRSTALDPKGADAPYYLGIVHERFRQHESALGFYKQAIANAPSNAQYVVAASEMLVQMKRLDEAEALLSTPHESLVHNSAIRHTQGQLAMVRGDYARASQLLEEARLLAPDDTAILESLVQAQFSAGQFAEAEYNISGLLKQKGEGPRRDLIHMRATCLEKLNRVSEARSLLLELTTDEGGQRDIKAWVALGELSARTKDYARLRLVGTRLCALSPDRPEGFQMRAMAMQAQGDLPGALKALDGATELPTPDAQSFVLKGLILSDLGQTREARAAFESALSLRPDDAQVRGLIVGLDARRPVATHTER